MVEMNPIKADILLQSFPRASCEAGTRRATRLLNNLLSQLAWLTNSTIHALLDNYKSFRRSCFYGTLEWLRMARACQFLNPTQNKKQRQHPSTYLI